MSLRTRMGLVAGLAVALAVVAVAGIVYAGTRSELRGQVDRALAGRIRGFLRPPIPPVLPGGELVRPFPTVRPAALSRPSSWCRRPGRS